MWFQKLPRQPTGSTAPDRPLLTTDGYCCWSSEICLLPYPVTTLSNLPGSSLFTGVTSTELATGSASYFLEK